MINRCGEVKRRDIGPMLTKKVPASDSDDSAYSIERITEREEMIKNYLDSFCCNNSNSDLIENIMPKMMKRVVCCGYSQSLYCSNCCQLLLPGETLPVTLRENPIKLPFDVLVVLTDLRNKATGVHAIAVCSNEQVTLLDLVENGSSLSGSSDQRDIFYNDDEADTTFVLFPCEDSIPLITVASRIKKIIVLDCKWTRTKNSGKLMPEFSKYQKVHLSTPPKESHYWRWHNAGEGMLSTIEAIFYASWEILEYQKDQRNNDIIHLLYIFGIQRALSGIQAVKLGKPSPYSKEGKEEMRALRRCIGTEKHLLDLEKGKRLKEQAKLKKEQHQHNQEDT